MIIKTHNHKEEKNSIENKEIDGLLKAESRELEIELREAAREKRIKALHNKNMAKCRCLLCGSTFNINIELNLCWECVEAIGKEYIIARLDGKPKNFLQIYRPFCLDCGKIVEDASELKNGCCPLGCVAVISE